MLDRRSFLVRTGLALGTGVLAGGCRPRLELVRGETTADLQDWRAVRGEFNLSRDYIHLTGFLLASRDRAPRALDWRDGGGKLSEGQHIMTTHHDHHPPAPALRPRAARRGASPRAVPLSTNPANANEEEITEALAAAPARTPVTV